MQINQDKSYEAMKRIELQSNKEMAKQNMKKYFRDKQYRELIKQQLNHKQILKQNHQKQKQHQRVILNHLVSLQRQYKLNKKKKMIQREYKFGLDNQKLMKKRRVKTQAYIQYQDPFVNLLDAAQQRKQKMRRRMKQQSLVNLTQINMKNLKLMTQKQQQKYKKKQFEDYVENMYATKQQQSKSLKLRIAKNVLKVQTPSKKDKVNLDEQSKKLNKKYLQDLIKQSQKKRKIHYSQRTQKIVTDQSLQQNQNQSNEFKVSPAYIGKVIVQNQRKKQLNMIDSKFGFKYEKLQTKNLLQRLQFIKQNSQMIQNPQKLATPNNTIQLINIQNKQMTNNAISKQMPSNQYKHQIQQKKLKNKSLMQLPQDQNNKTLPQISNFNSGYTNHHQSKINQIKQTKHYSIQSSKQTRQYATYDFITGSVKKYTVKA